MGMYKNNLVNIVHVTEIVQYFGNHREACDMALVYYPDEDSSDAFYVPASELALV